MDRIQGACQQTCVACCMDISLRAPAREVQDAVDAACQGFSCHRLERHSPGQRDKPPPYGPESFVPQDRPRCRRSDPRRQDKGATRRASAAQRQVAEIASSAFGGATSVKPTARIACALRSPTARTGNACNSARRLCAAIARAALALVTRIAAHGPVPISASVTGSMRNSEAMATVWPRARSEAAVRFASAFGASPKAARSGPDKKIGAGTLAQFAACIGAKFRRILTRGLRAQPRKPHFRPV